MIYIFPVTSNCNNGDDDDDDKIIIITTIMMVMINNKNLTLENNQPWKSNRYADDVKKQKLI